MTFSVSSAARPGLFDLKGKAKWDAWNGKKGKINLDYILCYYIKMYVYNKNVLYTYINIIIFVSSLIKYRIKISF